MAFRAFRFGENAPTLDHGNAVAYDDSTATVDNSETLFEANDSFSGTQSADSYPDQDSRTIDTSIEDSFNEEVKNENSVRRVSTTDNSTNVDVVATAASISARRVTTLVNGIPALVTTLTSMVEVLARWGRILPI